MSVLLFGSILIIQFVAMLFHRFGTLSHILASTDVSLFTRKVWPPDFPSTFFFGRESHRFPLFFQMEDLSEDAILEQSGVAIARELQKLRGIDEDDDDDDALQVRRRDAISCSSSSILSFVVFSRFGTDQGRPP